MQNVIISVSTLIMVLLAAGVVCFIAMRRPNKLNLFQKNVWLVLHIVFILIFFGGLLGSLLLVWVTYLTTDRTLLEAVHTLIPYFDHFMVIPGAFGSLITGIWLAARTQWGMTKHYWVIAKWVGNMAMIVFGGSAMRFWISETLHAAQNKAVFPLANPAYLEYRQLLTAGLVFSLIVLLFLVVISYFKPWGKRSAKKQP